MFAFILILRRNPR